MAELKLRKNEKGMILAIDMGNTNIVIGCVDDKKVLFEERLSTDYSKTEFIMWKNAQICIIRKRCLKYIILTQMT